MTIYLISCSNAKQTGGTPYPHDAVTLAGELDDVALRVRLFEARRQVRRWIGDRKLVDREKREGNRMSRPDNNPLAALGPDFGESAGAGQYMAACARYRGTFYAPVAERLWPAAWQPGTRTLIVSGLYGFLLPAEPIQLYSCHLADRLEGEANGLLPHWRTLLTDILLRVVDRYRVETIVDLLSEETYKEAIDWCRVYALSGITCYHCCFKLKAGPETLGNLGNFFAREVLDKHLADFSLNHDRFVSRDYFDEPEERLLFEGQIKSTGKAVAREGLGEGETWWRDRLGKPLWVRLPAAVRSLLANSEYSYSRNRDLEGFDFAQASIGLNKAIELWLNS